ncbi:MAG: F0F1 ATP synthase subunit B [Candidatus Cryptobacteroides sp.]
MSLVTPDFGLIVWMTLIFGIVFFVLAKWGFPMITDSVRERAERINASIKAAKEAEESLKNLEARQSEMIEEAKRQQAKILKDAAASGNAIIEKARAEAQEEAAKILEHAKTQIAAEKESALSNIRNEVAMLSVNIAEKVLRKELSDETRSSAYVSSMVDEVAGKRNSQSDLN